ncbi:hypothetical protein [Caulobacter sp. S45]|uniref:hypothetical protein n=1 Tax=Caulobacter sp. S45 TaxID=1641861 RepID=UPI00131B43CD|nr:hypothetical protein [Caulobacter sp. S45]
MSVMFIIAAAAAAATAATSPPAVPAAGVPAATAKTVAIANPDEKVCKRIVTTGTRFSSSDCRTRAEWAQLSADSRQATTDMTTRSTGFSGK